jgi:5'(3')-deoxyribonucleotidase
MICFLDLDGVLVNFVQGVLDYFSVDDFIVDHWRFDITLAAKLNISVAYFWSCFNQRFWESLKWMPDGKAILAACEERFGSEVYLLSSPCATEGCAEGKTNWVKRHLPQYSRKLFIGSAKLALASDCKVLVDDSDDNVTKFVVAGGKAILVARPWNTKAHLMHATVEDLTAKLKELR